MNQTQVDIHSLTFSLWRQALSGDTDGARYRLEQMDLNGISVLAADLLARLYVQAGLVAQAREIWGMILRIDPNYPPAVQAMQKLNSPWLIRAVAKKYSRWFAIFLALFFGIYGIVTMFFNGPIEYAFIFGTTIILTVLAIYLVGLFTWAYITAESLFGFGERMIYSQYRMTGTRIAYNRHSDDSQNLCRNTRKRDAL